MTSRAQSTPSVAKRLRYVLSLPPQWLHLYDDFVTKNVGQVSQIENALRSLTYVVPGRFRDAEIASEALHSSVQLLSLYHDMLLLRALQSPGPSPSSHRPHTPPPPPSASPPPHPSQHTRYTRYWAARSPLYVRAAVLLRVVQYTELLCEMAARRRGGERARWRVVVLLEALKAACRLAIWKVTRARPVMSLPLPEREGAPEEDEEEDEQEEEQNAHEELNQWLAGEGEAGEVEGAEKGKLEGGGEKSIVNGKANGTHHPNGMANGNGAIPHANGKPLPPAHTQPWVMPRTATVLPPLPTPAPSPVPSLTSGPSPFSASPSSSAASDMSSYLYARVLTADDIKPAPRLLRALPRGPARAAEALHLLAPLIFALALYRSHRKGAKEPLRDWTPWAVGLAAEVAARALREREGGGGGAGGGFGGGGYRLRESALERDEWSRRGWGMLWWAMRGAMYGNVVKPWLVDGVAASGWVPGIVKGVVEDWGNLWANYYFSTSAS